MRRGVVEDHVDVEVVGDGLVDDVQESAELLAPMPWRHLGMTFHGSSLRASLMREHNVPEERGRRRPYRRVGGLSAPDVLSRTRASVRGDSGAPYRRVGRGRPAGRQPAEDVLLRPAAGVPERYRPGRPDSSLRASATYPAVPDGRSR
jgi:hypothetical protein